MSSDYLEHRSSSIYYSISENWDCTNGFLLIVCTVMLQNYYEGKIVYPGKVIDWNNASEEGKCWHAMHNMLRFFFPVICIYKEREGESFDS